MLLIVTMRLMVMEMMICRLLARHQKFEVLLCHICIHVFIFDILLNFKLEEMLYFSERQPNLNRDPIELKLYVLKHICSFIHPSVIMGLKNVSITARTRIQSQLGAK